MTEIVKRLAPITETLREIFLKSGNICAFPGCGTLNMTEDGTFIAQICHIEAAEEGGERFNPLMSNEQRRQASNLMILCYPHHVETNNVSRFRVSDMKDMKKLHENKFSHPERAMLEQIKDWTELSVATIPKNMKKYAEMVEGLDGNHLAGSLVELAAYVNEFQRIPIEVRKFFSTVLKRVQAMRNYRVVRKSNLGDPIAIHLNALIGPLRLTEASIRSKLIELESYELVWIEIDDWQVEWVRICDISSGWQWNELYNFCDYLSIFDLDTFAVDLDFARLDG